MLEWNVFYSSFTLREIKTFNIFKHGGFFEDCLKAKKKYGEDRDAFEEEVRKSLSYYFWSKCEWEIILSHWPPREGESGRKIDVYEQVRMNWNAFTEYLWQHRGELKRSKNKDG